MNETSAAEIRALYDLIFTQEDPRSNPLMKYCISKNPHGELALYRRKVRRRYQKSTSLNGILADCFQRSIALLAGDDGNVVVEDFVSSAAFRSVCDIPGQDDERSLSQCFYDYLATIGPKHAVQFAQQLAIDFHQSLLVEATLSPKAPWIPHYQQLTSHPDGRRVTFDDGKGRCVILIRGNRILKYRVVS